MRLQRMGKDHRWVVSLSEDWAIKLELGRVRGSRWIGAEYGGQEDFARVTAGWGGGFWLTLETPFHLHHLRPRDGEYGESNARFGLDWSNGTGKIRLLFGHDWLGTHYESYGRGRLRAAWMNRELTLWHADWALGRIRTERTAVATVPATLAIEPGDEYHGSLALERFVCRRRFWLTPRDRWDWWFSMPRPGSGIPIPEDPDCDFSDGSSDAIFGFGESADRYRTMPEVLDALAARVRTERGGWKP